MIRPARPADLDDVFRIYMHPEVAPYLGYDEMALDGFRGVFGDLLASRSFLVMEVDGKVAGFCRVVRNVGRSRHSAYLGTFAVDPDLRGTGLAKQVLDAVISDLRRQGVLRVELTVLEDNPRAIAFYRRYGFQVEGTIRSSFKRSNQDHYVNEFALAKLFGPLEAQGPSAA